MGGVYEQYESKEKYLTLFPLMLSKLWLMGRCNATNLLSVQFYSYTLPQSLSSVPPYWGQVIRLQQNHRLCSICIKLTVNQDYFSLIFFLAIG